MRGNKSPLVIVGRVWNPPLRVIQGGFYAIAAFFEDMGVYHGGVEVFVAEEFLDGADIVPGGK